MKIPLNSAFIYRIYLVDCTNNKCSARRTICWRFFPWYFLRKRISRLHGRWVQQINVFDGSNARNVHGNIQLYCRPACTRFGKRMGWYQYIALILEVFISRNWQNTDEIMVPATRPGLLARWNLHVSSITLYFAWIKRYPNKKLK